MNSIYVSKNFLESNLTVANEHVVTLYHQSVGFIKLDDPKLFQICQQWQGPFNFLQIMLEDKSNMIQTSKTTENKGCESVALSTLLPDDNNLFQSNCREQ